MTLAGERFERRLAEELSKFRLDMSKEFSDVRREMSNMRVELLRWSFLFWLGRITVIAAMLSYMLRVLSP